MIVPNFIIQSAGSGKEMTTAAAAAAAGGCLWASSGSVSGGGKKCRGGRQEQRQGKWIIISHVGTIYFINKSIIKQRCFTNK